jgi:hypothetical protein
MIQRYFGAAAAAERDDENVDATACRRKISRQRGHMRRTSYSVGCIIR